MKRSILILTLIFITCIFVFAVNRTALVFVEGGNFSMGSEDGSDDEQPVHTVKVNCFKFFHIFLKYLLM